jgi:hypothetical protein
MAHPTNTNDEGSIMINNMNNICTLIGNLEIIVRSDLGLMNRISIVIKERVNSILDNMRILEKHLTILT